MYSCIHVYGMLQFCCSSRLLCGWPLSVFSTCAASPLEPSMFTLPTPLAFRLVLAGLNVAARAVAMCSGVLCSSPVQLESRADSAPRCWQRRCAVSTSCLGHSCGDAGMGRAGSGGAAWRERGLGRQQVRPCRSGNACTVVGPRVRRCGAAGQCISARPAIVLPDAAPSEYEFGR